MNPQAEQDGIAVDPQKVSQRAYARVAALTLQIDQWETAYEAQGLELAQTRAELDAHRAAGAAQPSVVDMPQSP